ncbi:MAG TPA: hypothetical protein VNE38_13680 [Ktedonobacteraceae bacterium]|nr:hypothetical protein [Ktedonobacteraceae bacterium]
MSSHTEVPTPAPVKKRPRFSRRTKIIIALVIISIAVVLAFFAPPEGDSTNVTGDTLPVTITVTNPLGTLAVSRGVDYNDVHITAENVTQASKFSDDRRPGGSYTIRVQLLVLGKKGQKAAIGIDFASLMRLQLANGQTIAPKLVNMSPVILPNQAVSGYIDFPVAAPVPLTSLTLRVGNSLSIPFA